MDAEFAERGLLQFAVGGMVFDRLRVAPKAVALVQHRGVAVGQPRAFVEMAAGKLTEPVKMRLDMAEQPIRQMDAQEIGQRRVGAVEIHAGSIRREPVSYTHLRAHETDSYLVC